MRWIWWNSREPSVQPLIASRFFFIRSFVCQIKSKQSKAKRKATKKSANGSVQNRVTQDDNKANAFAALRLNTPLSPVWNRRTKENSEPVIKKISGQKKNYIEMLPISIWWLLICHSRQIVSASFFDDFSWNRTTEKKRGRKLFISEKLFLRNVITREPIESFIFFGFFALDTHHHGWMYFIHHNFHSLSQTNGRPTEWNDLFCLFRALPAPLLSPCLLSILLFSFFFYKLFLYKSIAANHWCGKIWQIFVE